MMWKRIVIVFISFCSIGECLNAQEDSTYYDFGDFGGIIYLDSLTVTASRNGFDVEDFIDIVKTDESFYQAFTNIRTLSYFFENDFKMYDKKGSEKAGYYSQIKQNSDGRCRTMQILSETSSGDFYKKKKKYKYYTAKMFDKLFLTHGRVCETEEKSNIGKKLRGMDKHVEELKKLIFKPGSKADVPLIGKKTAIFSHSMIKYYNLNIQSSKYRNDIPCYVFTAQVKNDFLHRKKDKTVIKFLRTYFDKENFQVLGREYMLSYKAALYDFDVNMEIDLMKKGKTYLPRSITYDGRWDIPVRKPEISKFHIKFTEFQ